MSNSQRSKPSPSLSPYTLLAVTALSVSNLIVGLLQANSFLILSSASLSATFAFVYAVKSGMLDIFNRKTATSSNSQTANLGNTPETTAKPFQLWMFVALIFVLMPAILLFLERFEVSL